MEKLEVTLERLIMASFPVITEEETTPGLDGVPVEVWSGKLADLVTAILGETTPGYQTYREV